MAAAASIAVAAARAEGDAQKASAASPTEASPQKQKRKSSKENIKKSQEEEGSREAPEGISGRRSSPSQPAAAVVLLCLSGRTRVEAPLALAEEEDDGYPCVDTSLLVNFTPLPYAPVLAHGANEDCERPRSFVFKGQLIDIPLLPINRREQGAATRLISISQAASTGKGWAVVKSKMDGMGTAMQQSQPG